MSDFEKLKAPIFNGIGWYVVTEVGQAAWLTVNGDITSNPSTHKDILYHKTEGEAYRAMASYYNKHGRVYVGAATHCLQDDVKSQEMTF